MKTFKIPVSWTVSAEIKIQAETLKEAIKEFDTFEEEKGYMLPKEFNYIDGSFSRKDEEFCKMVNE